MSTPSKKRGRKPKLSQEEVGHVRWFYANTVMSMADLAFRYEVSPGTIQHVIDRKGAYK
jgi:hypothetical protein